MRIGRPLERAADMIQAESFGAPRVGRIRTADHTLRARQGDYSASSADTMASPI